MLPLPAYASEEENEDAQDLALLRLALAEDDGTRYSHEELKRDLGL